MPKAGRSYARRSTSSEKLSAMLQESLRLGYLLSEKCELQKAEEAFQRALTLAREQNDQRVMMEVISALLRLAGEALDGRAIQKWDEELDRLIASFPSDVPPMAWYCKGSIARHRDDYRGAQRYFIRCLRSSRKLDQAGGVPSLLTSEEELVRAWTALAVMLLQRGRIRRAASLGTELLRRYEAKALRGINGSLYILMGKIAETEKKIEEALRWYQKAHSSYLGEHNWYSHLYVLYAYARIARIQQNYSQAYWYLDLMDKAASGPEFGALKKEIVSERGRLEQDAVDLLIDTRKGVVRTRENGQISLRKQYVLLSILEALSHAHCGGDDADGEDTGQGLSKAEIIEKVWKEPYRPEAHDNKLYYNINRLRKLIEPDMRQPQYLLNWKEGYRLAPGLRVHRIGLKNMGGKNP